MLELQDFLSTLVEKGSLNTDHSDEWRLDEGVVCCPILRHLDLHDPGSLDRLEKGLEYCQKPDIYHGCQICAIYKHSRR